MEILISKLIPLFIYPLGLSLILSIYAWISLALNKKNKAVILLSSAILVLLVSSNGYVAHWLISSIESEYPPVTIEDTPQADAAIVLGGGLQLPLPPRIYADFNSSADRLLHSFRLYQAGKIKYIIFTGGNVFPEPSYEGEAAYAAEILQEWGIPESAIIQENSSRNTLQNAEYTKEIVTQRQFKRLLLVTSARHMKRALTAFKQEGLNTLPIPVDYYAVKTSTPGILGWIPNVKAMNRTSSALHEHLGRLWYLIRPWIKGD